MYKNKYMMYGAESGLEVGSHFAAANHVWNTWQNSSISFRNIAILFSIAYRKLSAVLKMQPIAKFLQQPMSICYTRYMVNRNNQQFYILVQNFH
mgnify:CR=1 FL=1